jgi:hypothetical protein
MTPKATAGPRLGGGPKLDGRSYGWWRREQERVASLEHLARCSMRTLLSRIAAGDMDLSMEGLQRYAGLLEKRWRR